LGALPSRSSPGRRPGDAPRVRSWPYFEAGAWGVFGVQNAGKAGVEREEAQGKRLAIPGS